MKSEQIHALTEDFEAHAQETENGVEYWLARDVQHLLDYAEWRNFLNVIGKAKTACESSGHAMENHFVAINKMVNLGSLDDLIATAGRKLEALRQHKRGLMQQMFPNTY